MNNTSTSSAERFRPIIRVFVSSTFSDLVHERNVLQERVWPELERYCLVRGFQFQAIDLRWGVSTEAGLDHRAMRICFEELRRSQEVSPRPNFLILLGDRYGWQPLPEKITPHEFDDLKRATAGDPEQLRILADWYRLDENAFPPIHLLRSRRESPDGEDYTTDANGQDSTAWTHVQNVLWSLINRVFPVSMLASRFATPVTPTSPIPSIVRFQGSATEQEIWHGAFRVADAPGHVVAFSREIENLDAFDGHERLRDFVNVDQSQHTDPNLHDAVRALKSRLRQMLGENYLEAPQPSTLQAADAPGGEPRLEISTDHLDSLCAHVRDTLLPIIRQQIDEYDQVPETAEDAPLSAEVLRDLRREREEHARFAEQRAPVGVFVGRQAEKGKILAYLSGESERPFVLHGVSGSGKSALMAAAGREAVEKSGAIVLQRFLGISQRSSDLRSLLIDLCQSLREHFPRDDELPTDIRLMEKKFYEQLSGATAERPVYVLLDALDQLDAAEAAHSLWWIRSTPLPSHARLVVSCLSDPDNEVAGRPWATLNQRGFVRPENSVGIEYLEPSEAQRLWKNWLDQAGRTLSDQQQEAVDRVIHAETACRQPLYLRILFEEARLWRSYDPPGPLGTSVPELLAALFDRLSDPAVHGPLVEPAMGYLASARYGLAESELLEILLRDPEYKPQLLASAQHALPPDARRIPIAIWSRLRYDLSPYLSERGAPGGSVLHFFHRQVGDYVRERFAGTAVRSYQWHRRLALYFARQPWWLEPRERQRERMKPPYSARPAHVRKITELPDQLLALAREAKAAGLKTKTEQAYQWIERLFKKLSFLEAKNEAGRVFELVSDFVAAIEALPTERPGRQILDLLQEALRRDIHFIARHAEDYPQALFQCLWNNAWWYDCDLAAAHYIEPEDDSNKGNASWLKLKDEKLCLLLEQWRLSNEKRCPSATWLLSRRPPLTPLGTLLKAILRGHESSVTSVTFSLDGECIASGSSDNTVRLWDTRSGKELAVLRGHENYVSSVAFSPDGDLIASGSDDKTVRLWDTQSGAELAVLRGNEGPVSSVAFSPDGDRIVSGSDDKTVRVWDARNGKELAVLRGHDINVSSVAFFPDGDRIASGSCDETVRVWDARSGKELAVFRGHKSHVRSVVLSPDGDCIASGSEDNTVRVWDSRSGVELAVQEWDTPSVAELAVLRGHEGPVESVVFSPEGDRIASGSRDTTVRVWDARSGEELAVLRGHENYVSSVAFSPDGDLIASGSSDNTVRLWDAHSGEELAVLRGHDSWVYSVAFSPDGDRIASGSLDNTLWVWDARSGAELAVLREHESFVTSVTFSPDGKRIASGSRDKTVRVWDAHSGEELAVLRGHESVVFSPEWDRIASGSRDTTVRVWDARSGEELAVLRGHDSWVYSVAFSPDGDRIASGSLDNTVRVWDSRSGVELAVQERDTPSVAELAVLRGHEGPVESVVFSPEGDRIASGSRDTTVRVWDARSGEELAVLRGHDSWVYSVAFSPDGDRIVSRGEFRDKTVRVWDAETGECLEVIQGDGDVGAIAAGLPLRAIARDLETVVEPKGGGELVARFPVTIDCISTHPSGRTWAGSAGNHLYILSLEGGAKEEPRDSTS